MKWKYYRYVMVLVCAVFMQLAGHAQAPAPDPKKDTTEPVNTEVFWLDLCNPHKLTSVKRTSSGRNRYEVNWKNNLSFVLTNINQFKNDYKINSIPFAAFVDTNYASFQGSASSVINILASPAFKFLVTTKSPTKEKFKKLRTSIDSATDAFAQNQRALFEIINTVPGVDKPGKAGIAKKDRDEYTALLRKKYDLAYLLSNLYDKSKLFSYLYPGEYNALKKNLGRLEVVDKFLYVSPSAIFSKMQNEYIGFQKQSFVEQTIDSTSRGRTKKDTTYTNNTGTLIYCYQQNAEYIRLLYSQFEINYEKEKSFLLGATCKCYTPLHRDSIQTFITKFLNTRMAFIELVDLYTISPVQDDYLEAFLTTEQQYSDMLYSRYMGLQNIINLDTTYIIPTSSNMKNFDLIKIELEKTDKVTKQTEKYDYDIFIKGGLKVDFSAGIFGSFLKNYEYYTTDQLDAQNKPNGNKMILEKRQGAANVGFGAMANVTVRTGASWFAPGGSVGFILDTKPSLQFLTSFTLAMGKTERLLLHAGYAFGFVKKLDGNLNTNTYIPAAVIGNTVPTNDRFMARPFFGLSYNLSKNNVFKVTSFSTATTSSSGGSSGGDATGN